MPDDAQPIIPPSGFVTPKWTRPFSFMARHIKGWNFLLFLALLPLAITAVAAPPAIVYELCEGDRNIDARRTFECLQNNTMPMGLLNAAAGLVVLLTFVVLASGFAWSGHRRRARQLRRAYEKRIQSLRDHVIAGTANPDSFDEVQRLWKPLVRGEHPAVRARAGTASSIIFNVLVSLTFGIGLTVYVIGLIVFSVEGPDSDTAEFRLVWNAVFVPHVLLLFATMVWGWVKCPGAHALAVQANHEAIDSAERTEIRVFAPPSQRRSRTAVVAGGPSFSPYGERIRPE